MNIEKKNEITPTAAKWYHAVFVVVCMLALMVVGVGLWGQDPHIMIFLTIIIEMIIGLPCGRKWKDLIGAFVGQVSQCIEAIFILCLVGMLIGAMVWSGTIASIVYYGLHMLTPKTFLPVGALILAVVGLATGSSWTAIGTVGVAFMAVGQGLGISPAVIAGLCISGGYLGDKFSPLSDSTNLAAATAQTPLFRHVRAMATTTFPSFAIALVIWTVMGLFADGTYDTSLPDEICNTIMGYYDYISPVLLLPVVIIIIVCVLQVPAEAGLAAGIFSSLILAMIFQGASLNDCITAMHFGYEGESGNEIVDYLINRGGMDSMMWTINLIILAVGFGGIFVECGFVEALFGSLIKKVRTPSQLVLLTLVSSIFCDFLLADQYLAIVIPGTMYKEKYDELGLDRSFLSRTLEDAGTLWSPLCPWNACGVYCTATLGMGPLVYGPWAFMNLINPIYAVVTSYLGIGVKYADGTSAWSRQKSEK